MQSSFQGRLCAQLTLAPLCPGGLPATQAGPGEGLPRLLRTCIPAPSARPPLLTPTPPTPGNLIAPPFSGGSRVEGATSGPSDQRHWGASHTPGTTLGTKRLKSGRAPFLKGLRCGRRREPGWPVRPVSPSPARALGGEGCLSRAAER